MSSVVTEAVAERLAGEQPSRTRAFYAAFAAAVAAGALTYKLLRSEPSRGE
jgi:hypothetical protein